METWRASVLWPTVRRDVRRPSRRELRVTTRLFVIASASWFISYSLDLGTTMSPAVLAVILTLRDDPFETYWSALSRVVGVLLGAVIGVAALRLVPSSGAVVIVSLGLGLVGSLLIRYQGSPNRQVVITALLIVSTSSPGYPEARLLETCVGLLSMVVFGPLVLPPNPVQALTEDLSHYTDTVSQGLSETADRLEDGRPAPTGIPVALSTALHDRPDAMLHELAAACRALRWTPPPRRRSRTAALAELQPRLDLAERTSVSVHYFLEQSRESTFRHSAEEDPALADIAPFARATNLALTRALGGRGSRELVAGARAQESAHRAAHPGPAAGRLRTGLHAVLDTVEEHLNRPGGSARVADDGSSRRP